MLWVWESTHLFLDDPQLLVQPLLALLQRLHRGRHRAPSREPVPCREGH
jgi:hypothetical protein